MDGPQVPILGLTLEGFLAAAKERVGWRRVALRDGALVFDGPASALTPAFLRELYGTSADELIDAVDAPAVDASPPILPILSRSIP